MADFHKAFEAIDEDGSGEITVEELEHYMIKNNYKESFVSKWLILFDGGKSGKITYQHYCETLGLEPREREVPIKKTVSKKEEKSVEKVEHKTVNKSKVKEDQSDKVKKIETSNSKSKRSSKSRSNCFSKHKRNLRPNIKPGCVLILLTSIHRGKKVIFLKQLSSGLLLVTGPFKLNGCPLRRVHQKMVIGTKTKLDITDINIPEHLTDEYFSRKEDVKKKSVSADMNIFSKTKKQYVLKEQRKEDQKIIDKQISNLIKKRNDKSMFANYLRSLFSLSSNDYPHKMKF